MKKLDTFDKYFGYYLLLIGVAGIITFLKSLIIIDKQYLSYIAPYILPLFCFTNIVVGYNIIIGVKLYYIPAFIFQIIQITIFNFNDKYFKLRDEAFSIGIVLKDGIISQFSKYPDIEYTMSSQPIIDNTEINFFPIIMMLLIIYRFYLRAKPIADSRTV